MSRETAPPTTTALRRTFQAWAAETLILTEPDVTARPQRRGTRGRASGPPAASTPRTGPRRRAGKPSGAPAHLHAGLAAARARGGNGGRPKTVTAEKVAVMRQMYAAKEPTVERIAATVGVSRQTVYRYLADHETSPTSAD